MRTTIRDQSSEVEGREPRRLGAVAIALALLAFASTSSAQMVVDWGFTPGTIVPDNGSVGSVHTLGGFASYSNINVSLNLTSANPNDPMFLGDMYSNLTLGSQRLGETQRTAVLLNRPGRDNMNAFGSSLSALNVTLDDSAVQPNGNIWGTTTGTGTYNSDGRLGVNPNAAGVAFSNGDRNATLAALTGTALPSNRFSLLVADYAQGGTATLSSYGYGVTGAAAGSGTLSGDGGTFSISDTGSGATNNVGAAVVTTQPNGALGTLAVNIAGTMNFTNVVSGTSGLTKSGGGTLTLSAANTYTGATTIAASGGTLVAGVGSLLSTSSVTVNSGGTLLLSGNGRHIGANTGVILNGGTFNTGGLSEPGTGPGGEAANAIGALTLTSTSTIDFGLSNTSVLEFAGLGTHTGGSVLQITNWDGVPLIGGSGDRLLFLGTATTFVGAYSQSEVSFNGTLGYTAVQFIDGTFDYYEIVATPVPEPSTWFAAALAFGGIIFTQRRRFSRKPTSLFLHRR